MAFTLRWKIHIVNPYFLYELFIKRGKKLEASEV